MKTRLVWALSAATVAAGCANLGPLDAADAAVPPALAPAWNAPVPGNASAPRTVDPASPAAVWQALADPLLPPLIDAARQASPTLASAAASIERARASQTQAAAALLPTLALAGNASQGRNAPRAPIQSLASLGVQAGWEIDLFGANRSARNAAGARLEGAQAAWFDAQTALAAQVASTYTALRGCEAQLVQVRADSDSRAQTTRLTEESARAGFTAPADAALARAGAAQSRNQVVAQAAACDTLIKSLVELTALAEPDLRRTLATRSAQVPPAPGIAVPAVPAALLAQRPDLAEAARNVEAAAADVAQSRARELPQISLAGTVAGASLRTMGETTSGATWSFGPLVVNFPLFDAGARAAATSAARAGYTEAVALYQAQARRAVREVESALVAWQSATEREADARAAATDFETSLRATEARQRGGLASLFDLEAARRNAVAAQSALIDLQRERTTAWIDLVRALGGGFDASRIAAAGSDLALPTSTATPR